MRWPLRIGAVGAVEIGEAIGGAFFADLEVARRDHGRFANDDVVFRAAADARNIIAQRMPRTRQKPGLTNQPRVQARVFHLKGTITKAPAWQDVEAIL